MAAYLGVVGPGQASEAQIASAEAVGRLLGEAGVVLICGGMGGVMAAACKGAREAGGTAVGILPGSDRAAGNEWLTVAIPTGLGELRNGLVVRGADALIAIGGAYGTLSEVALALKRSVPVVGLGTWDIEGITRAQTPADAVERALRLAGWPASSLPT